MNKLPFLVGAVSLKSQLTLERVAKIVSEKIFGGLPFGGKELMIHEEVPAIMIEFPIMGLKIVIDGYSGFDEDAGFSLSIIPWDANSDIEYLEVSLDRYLIDLLRKALLNQSDIIVVD